MNAIRTISMHNKLLQTYSNNISYGLWWLDCIEEEKTQMVHFLNLNHFMQKWSIYYVWFYQTMSLFFFPTKTSLSILIKCQEHMKNTTIMCLQCLSPEEKPCLATTQAATSVIRVGEMSGWCYVWTSDSYSDDLILFSVSPALTDLSFCSLFSITVCVWCSVTCFPGWSHLINSINGNCCSLCPDACPHKNVS